MFHSPSTLHLPSFPPSPTPTLRFLLPRLRRPRLGRLLTITPYHDHAQKAAHDCRGEKNEDDGYADGPDARREEVVEGVALVDEGLGWGKEVLVHGCDGWLGQGRVKRGDIKQETEMERFRGCGERRTMRRVHVV